MKTTTTKLQILITIFAMLSGILNVQAQHHHDPARQEASLDQIHKFFANSSYTSEEEFQKQVFGDDLRQNDFLKKYYSKIDLDKSILIDLVEDKKMDQVAFNLYLLKKKVEYSNLFQSYIKDRELEEMRSLRAGSGTPVPFGPGQPCQNMDFESQTLNAWVGSYGSSDCDPVMIAGFDNPGINSGTGQHVIMTGGTDPNVPAIPCVMPGGTASLRLGDDGGGWNRAARISQTFMVQAANPYFTYNYAVVLEDAGHVLAEQPYFRIRMYDGSSNLISCATLDVDATNAPGLVVSGGIKY